MPFLLFYGRGQISSVEPENGVDQSRPETNEGTDFRGELTFQTEKEGPD